MNTNPADNETMFGSDRIINIIDARANLRNCLDNYWEHGSDFASEVASASEGLLKALDAAENITVINHNSGLHDVNPDYLLQ